jgi:hypothetical protein
VDSGDLVVHERTETWPVEDPSTGCETHEKEHGVNCPPIQFRLVRSVGAAYEKGTSDHLNGEEPGRGSSRYDRALARHLVS